MPARGVERWLSQRLSHHLGRDAADDGVCAGVTFRSPRSLIAEVTGTQDDDPWAPDALVWPLLAVVDASAGEDWCRTLGTHLGHGQTGEEGELRRGRRYAVARRLARLFSSYAVQRPRLLADWEAGVDSDGTGSRIDPDLLWQPELWRRLVAAVGAPSPGVRHARVLEQLREGPGTVDLPQRLSLFGHTRIAAHRGRAARRARRAPRRPPLAAAPLRRAVAIACRPGRRGAATRRPLPPGGRPPVARVPGPRRARAGAHAAGAAAGGRAGRALPGGRRRPRPCSAWLQDDIAANTLPDPATRHLAETTAACRCTPATVRPARSRCCARCCSACSPTTRPSSRATSW